MEILLKVDSDNPASIREAIEVLNRVNGDVIKFPDPPHKDVTEVFKETTGSLVSSLPNAAPLVPQTESQSTPSEPTVELDASGAEWNEELHSSSKSKMKNGNWRPKRGTNPAPTTDDTPEPTAAPVAPPPPTPEETPNMVVGDSSKLFQEFMIEVTTAGRSIEEINGACSQVGLPTVNTLLANPQLIPAVRNLLGLV